MKLLSIVILSLILLTSCNTKCPPLEGGWHYIDNEGKYAEMWLDGKDHMIDYHDGAKKMKDRAVKRYTYSIAGDTIFLVNQYDDSVRWMLQQDCKPQSITFASPNQTPLTLSKIDSGSPPFGNNMQRYHTGFRNRLFLQQHKDENVMPIFNKPKVPYRVEMAHCNQPTDTIDQLLIRMFPMCRDDKVIQITAGRELLHSQVIQSIPQSGTCFFVALPKPNADSLTLHLYGEKQLTFPIVDSCLCIEVINMSVVKANNSSIVQTDTFTIRYTNELTGLE